MEQKGCIVIGLFVIYSFSRHALLVRGFSLLHEHAGQLITLLLCPQVSSEALLEELERSLITRYTQQLHRPFLKGCKTAHFLNKRSDKFGVRGLFLKGFICGVGLEEAL